MGRTHSGFCFFFSSRRRHTRYWRDWSSDVCSSDLRGQQRHPGGGRRHLGGGHLGSLGQLGGHRRGRGFGQRHQIGRASWRERGEISVGAVSLKKKKNHLLRASKYKIIIYNHCTTVN